MAPRGGVPFGVKSQTRALPKHLPLALALIAKRHANLGRNCCFHFWNETPTAARNSISVSAGSGKLFSDAQLIFGRRTHCVRRCGILSDLLVIIYFSCTPPDYRTTGLGTTLEALEIAKSNNKSC